MKRNAGFTLIELVIVIIVLGILAATAVPKFINLQDDAKEAAMKGAEAALQSAANIVFSKSAIDGTEKNDNSVGSKVNDINIAFGFPTAASAGIGNAVELSGFTVGAPATVSDSNTIAIFAGETVAKDALCILYKQATSSAATGTYKVTSTKFTTDTQCGA